MSVYVITQKQMFYFNTELKVATSCYRQFPVLRSQSICD